MIQTGSGHRCVMATFVINAQKIGDANNNKQRMTTMGNIRAQTDKNGYKEAFTFEERYQELEEKIKQEAAAAKSNLEQNEDGRTAGTKEAEAGTDTRATAPHDQEADANTAAAKEKPVTVRCNAQPQRSNNETIRL